MGPETVSADPVDYDHSLNLHSRAGAERALATLFGDSVPSSILDVGCGTGTWLRSALDLGASDVVGVDGVVVPVERLHIEPSLVRHVNLERPLDLGRKFDLIISLEVAEHLSENAAPTFVDTLVRHGDLILFAAAAPNQDGMHHVNCRWPIYWQALFNERGFSCDDWPRWKLWDDGDVEPWYRQNIFMARRDKAAGSEARLKSVIHPDALDCFAHMYAERFTSQIEDGSMPFGWYPRTAARVFLSRMSSKFRG